MVRRLLYTLAGLALVGAGVAPNAPASTLPTDCNNFGTTLSGAGNGDTIVLSGLCTSANAHFTLPATANLTIQGAATGTNGFDGTGVSSPALASPAGGTDGIAIQNLIFENYSSSRAVSISVPVSFGSANLSNPYSFLDNTFSHNSNPTADGGGLVVDLVSGISGSCTLSGPTVTISGSTFSANTTPGFGVFPPGAEGGGAGAFVDLECHSGSASVDISNNTFSGNTVAAPMGVSREGGGLFVGLGRHLSGVVPISLAQTGNVFDGNAVTGTGGSYAGGGEITVGANLSSSGDRFVNNTLPGPTASGKSSEGGGLSTRSGGDCASTPGVTSQAVNLVAAGNSIGAPSGGGAAGEGAGIYAGCFIGSGGYHLTLLNATISGNQVSGGGVPGIDGEATDVLDLKNTIVNGNTGGQEIGGFGASDGANVTAASSDVCAIGSASTPFAGAGNICVPPALVNPGPGAADVHETAASPTIDAGLNAFVSVPTDVFGGPRILAGRLGDGEIVDIGAVEFPAAVAPKPPDNSFKIGKVKGKILFVTVASAGTVKVIQASGTGRVATASAKRRLLKPSSASGGPGTVKVRLKLTARAKKKLTKKGKLKVKAQVTFTPTGGTANSKRATLRLKHKHRR
jgi:hypothetical protein